MRGHVSDVQAEAKAEAELKDSLAKDWDAGTALVASGTKNIADGEKKVESAEDDLEEGQDQVELGNEELAEGTELVESSERRFGEAFGEAELSGSD